MIECINKLAPLFTALATIFAAIAAYLSYTVAKRNSIYTINLSLHKETIEEINKIKSRLEKLRNILITQNASDEEITSSDSLLHEINSKIRKLSNDGPIEYDSIAITKIKLPSELIDDTGKCPAINDTLTTLNNYTKDLLSSES